MAARGEVILTHIDHLGYVHEAYRATGALRNVHGRCRSCAGHQQGQRRPRGAQRAKSLEQLAAEPYRIPVPPHPPRAPAAPCSTPVPPPLPLFAPCAGGAIRGGYAAGLGVGVTR